LTFHVKRRKGGYFPSIIASGVGEGKGGKKKKKGEKLPSPNEKKEGAPRKKREKRPSKEKENTTNS